MDSKFHTAVLDWHEVNMNNLILVVAVVVCLTNTGWTQSETAESPFLDHKPISLQQAIADRDGAATGGLLDPVYTGKFKLECGNAR